MNIQQLIKILSAFDQYAIVELLHDDRQSSEIEKIIYLPADRLEKSDVPCVRLG